MLSSFYNVPFRKDVITRASREALRTQNLSLEVLGNLSTILGFVGNISSIPTAQLSRLSFPCFCIVDKSLVLIHDIQQQSVHAVFPEFGPVKCSISDLTGSDNGLRVLTLSPGRDSQQRKLNFAWFFLKFVSINVAYLKFWLHHSYCSF